MNLNMNVNRIKRQLRVSRQELDIRIKRLKKINYRFRYENERLAKYETLRYKVIGAIEAMKGVK